MRCWRWAELAGWVQVLEPGMTAIYRPAAYRDCGNLARTWLLTDPRSALLSPRSGSAGEVVTTPQPRSAQAEGLDNSRHLTEVTKPRSKSISEKGKSRVAARFFAAGWLPADVDYAHDHGPDGRPYRFDDPPRWPLALMRARLAKWLNPDGTPLPSRSQQLAAEHVRLLAEQAGRRAARAAALEKAERVDQAEMAGRAREQLQAALRRPAAG